MIYGNGRLQNMLLGTIDVKQSNAEGIADELEKYITDLRIIHWNRRLIALGTDGASVNIGVRAGLGALLHTS